MALDLVTHTVDVAAPAQSVWSRLVEWQTWPSWDGGMQSISFDGPIDVGSIGRLKLNGGPVVQLHICSLTEEVEYSDYFDIFGTRMILHHDMKEIAPGLVRLTFSAQAEGPTALLVGAFAAASLSKKVPVWMETFKRQCETAVGQL